ncbi:hypothetical protein P8C59_005879 [Phyllachora maydis]|uniref:Mmc1 C-terminal domain-containing protein n=1 Tax=Phyllachora maydis TaxID=1825666 RepID=A0AAD9I5K5_9PEZI|nr:hypothetical protein P8C59_005879 [Phyllachora maydis]
MAPRLGLGPALEALLPRRPFVPLRRKAGLGRRSESTSDASAPPADPRTKLEKALTGLKKHASAHVNLARLQLALCNLRQQPGRESIRIAVLGFPADGDGASAEPAKKLMRLVLADPLKPEEDWESQVERHDAARPLLVRVDAAAARAEPQMLEIVRKDVLPEITVSSPGLNGNNLEVLLRQTVPPAPGSSVEALEEALLVPLVDMPRSSAGTRALVATPVHKAIVVGSGIHGLMLAMSLPLAQTKAVAAVIDLSKVTVDPQELSCLPITTIDLPKAARALHLFRESVQNAVHYETLWSDSGIGAVVQHLRADAVSNVEGTTKGPVRDLISSILQNTARSIEAETAQRLLSLPSGNVPAATADSLQQGLADWAQKAHEELQEQLDLAFRGSRWRKLGWWKLFWRVDDVGMLSYEMIAQRFLPEAERGMVFFAGRMQEAGISAEQSFSDFTKHDNPLAMNGLPPGYGLYEASAVAALGIVWSLRRLQKKWEVSRAFWEADVREKGRSALRVTEDMVADVLERNIHGRTEKDDTKQELEKARELVKQAEEALSMLK